MLSVTSATVHRSMCPGTSTNSSPQRPERNGGGPQTWNCDFNIISSRCNGLSATKNSISVRPVEPTDVNTIELKSKKNLAIDEENNSEYRLGRNKILVPESSNISSDTKYLNPFYKKGLLSNKSSDDDDPVKNESEISSDETSVDTTGKKRKLEPDDETASSPKPVKLGKILDISKKESSTNDINDTEEDNFFQQLENHETTKESADQADFQNLEGVMNWTDWDAENVSKSDPFQESTIHPDMPYYMIGFPNPPGENRCWLNATLHALFALPLVDQLDRLDVSGSSRLTKTLIALQLFWKQGPTEQQKTYQTVTKLKDELGVLDSTYPSERQQDVSEFLMIFLNYVKTECEQLLLKAKELCGNDENLKSPVRSPQNSKKRPPLTPISPFKRRINFNENTDWPTDESRSSIKVENTSDKILKTTEKFHHIETNQKNPIDDFFLLHMMEHYVCQDCFNHRQRKIDNLMLYVDLPENESETTDLVQSITKSMESEERILTCGKCKGLKHNVYTSFRRTPNVLIVQIKRYGMTSEGFVTKINTPVHIPETLTLETSSDSIQEEQFIPVCMIAHVGAAMDCGHYTSYVKHADQWYHYNDLNVMPMSNTEALTAAETTAYLVFFVNVKLLSKSVDYSDIEQVLR